MKQGSEIGINRKKIRATSLEFETGFEIILASPFFLACLRLGSGTPNSFILHTKKGILEPP